MNVNSLEKVSFMGSGLLGISIAILPNIDAVIAGN